MSVLLAFCSAICFSFSTIITKKGIQGVPSNLASFIRMGITFLFTLLLIFLTQAYLKLSLISIHCLLPLLLSGICSGCSWLCYFKALQMGDVSIIAPVDNFSTVLTMLLALLFLHEALTTAKVIALILLTAGTFLIAAAARQSGSGSAGSSFSWLPFSLLALGLGSLSSILVKLSLRDIDSTLVTGIRNLISLFIASIVLIHSREYQLFHQITCKNLLCLIASGLLVGISALCSYQAL